MGRLGNDALLADANGRLGSSVWEAVGGACPDVEDDNGLLFHNALCDVKLCAVSTWHGEKGSQHAYQCNAGSTHRIDYACAPAGLEGKRRSARGL
eukprot:492434-Pyramimonas_sp.AAC.1